MLSYKFLTGLNARICKTNHAVITVSAYRCLSSLRSGVWSLVSFLARPFLHNIARLSPTLPTTSSMPSRNIATVAVVPAVKNEAEDGETNEPVMNVLYGYVFGFSMIYLLFIKIQYVTDMALLKLNQTYYNARRLYLYIRSFYKRVLGVIIKHTVALYSTSVLCVRISPLLK